MKLQFHVVDLQINRQRSWGSTWGCSSPNENLVWGEPHDVLAPKITLGKLRIIELELLSFHASFHHARAWRNNICQVDFFEQLQTLFLGSIMKDLLNKYLSVHFHKSITDRFRFKKKKFMQKNNAKTFWKIRAETCPWLNDELMFHNAPPPLFQQKYKFAQTSGRY